MAIAAAGAIEYHGIATNEERRKWLDSTSDCCTMYLAGKEKELAKRLGGGDAFMAKVEKYFGGTMMDARRMLEPPDHISDNDAEDDDEEDDEGDAE